MASRTTALLITAAIAIVVMGALLPATAWADEDDEGQDAEGPSGGGRDGEEVDGIYYITVGDDAGWNLGVDYKEWAKYETFNVGDTLRFNYSTQQPYPHNVVAVDKTSFGTCTVPTNYNPVTLSSGNDIVPLWNPGPYYFFSSLNGDCMSGMKLSINVAQ